MTVVGIDVVEAVEVVLAFEAASEAAAAAAAAAAAVRERWGSDGGGKQEVQMCDWVQWAAAWGG